MGRVYVYSVSLAIVGLVVSPGLREPDDDGFPLSTYPMFSRDRPRRMTLTHAVAVDEDGERAPLPPQLTSGNMEVLQSMATIWRAVHSGVERRRDYCEMLARRVAAAPDDEYEQAVAVELATQVYDSVAYFETGGTVEAREVHARCEVPRR